MVDLSPLLHDDCIELDLDSRKQEGALKEMVDLIFRAGRIKSPDTLVQNLLQRERLTSTGIGEGIAIPHVLSDEVQETLIAFGRSTGGIRYRALDKQPVHLLFMMIGPTGHEYRHLQLLSRLARFVHDMRFRQRLLEADTVQQIIQAFKDMEEREG
jgi:PTS system fructose-specific IIC component